MVQKYILCLTSSYVFITHDPREKLITKAEFDVVCYILSSSTCTVVLYLYVWQPCIGATFPFYRAIKSASFSFLLTISCWGKLHVRVLNMAHYFLPHTFFSMGSFNNYVDTTLTFFDLPILTRLFFLWTRTWTKISILY